MAHETPTSGSSYPFYVAILGTCAVAITYYAGQSDLVSSRPALDSASMTEPHALFGMRSAFSRIWEDPFEFLALMDSAEPGTPSPRRRDETHEQLASLAATGQLVVLPVLVAGGPYPEDAEERKRINCAVSSALFSMGYEMGYRERIDLPQGLWARGGGSFMLSWKGDAHVEEGLWSGVQGVGGAVGAGAGVLGG